MASMSPIFFCFLRAGVNFPAPVYCVRLFRMSGPSLRLATLMAPSAWVEAV